MKAQPTRTSTTALDTGRTSASDKGAAVGRRAGGAPTASGALLHRFADVGMAAPQGPFAGAPAAVGPLSAAPGPSIQRDRENEGAAVPAPDELDIGDYALGPLHAVAPDAETGPGIAGPAIAAEGEEEDEEGVLGEEGTVDPDYDASADAEEEEEELPALSLASALLRNYGVSQPQPQFQDFFASLLSSQGPVINLPSLPAPSPYPSPYSFGPPSPYSFGPPSPYPSPYSFGTPSSFGLPSSSATVEPEEEEVASRPKRKTTDTGGEALFAQAFGGSGRSPSRRSLRIKRQRRPPPD